MKVLVIGGGGYLGSVLTKQLLDRNYDVGVFQRFVREIPEVESLAKNLKFSMFPGDVRNESTLIEPMKDCDAVIHLAGEVGALICESDKEEAIRINCTATRNVIRACRSSNVRQLIFASSCSVYGASDDLVNESSRLNPVDYYAKTKLASEADVLMANNHTLTTTILRMGTIFGLSPKMRFDLVINLLTAKACTEGRITVRGGNQWRPFVHVRDAAEAYVKVLESPIRDTAGKIFNVGSNKLNMTIGDVGERIQTLIPQAQLIHEPPDDPRNYRVDFSKITRELRFEAKVSFEQGVGEIIGQFKLGRFKRWADDPQYSTFKQSLGEYYRTVARSRVST